MGDIAPAASLRQVLSLPAIVPGHAPDPIHDFLREAARRSLG